MGKKTNFKTSLVMSLFLLAIVSTAGAEIIYVDVDAPGPTHDGDSWANAYTSLQDALTDAQSSSKDIWVAAGTYYPDTTGLADHREATFQMINGVAIYGGFAGGETSLAERDWETNYTVLSGDIGTPDDSSDNSYHVFYHPTGTYLDTTAVLDGFTITGANAVYYGQPLYGGGMYNRFSSPTVTNCTFSANTAGQGGGMCNWSSHPMVTNCTLSGNTATVQGGGVYIRLSGLQMFTNCTFSDNTAGEGGGMYNFEASPEVTNCTFSGNTAGDGGGVGNYHSDPTFTNCTFYDNTASPGLDNPAALGGGMYNDYSTPILTNCTFSGNEASQGGGMYNFHYCSPPVTNCIFWGDTPDEVPDGYVSVPVMTYCNVDMKDPLASPYPGTGNINADPLFVNQSNWDLRLQASSPCINAGDNTAVPPDTTDLDGDGDTAEPIPFDLDGNLRILNGIVDMGAYESPFEPEEPELPCGLVSKWPGDGDALDSIGENHGELRNGATFASGKVGQAFSLDGLDDCIIVSNSLSLSLNNFQNGYTMEAWINPSSISSGYHMIVGKGQALFGLRLNGERLQAYHSSSSGVPVWTSSLTFSVGTWYHIAATWDNSTDEWTIYIDGTQKYSGSNSDLVLYGIASDAEVTIGRESWYERWYFNGLIDEVAIYNCALDADEIRDIFLASAGAGYTPLGSNVLIQLLEPVTQTQPVTVTFNQVTGAGMTSLTTSSSGPLPPPSGFEPAGEYYDLATTASYSGPVTVCIEYDDTGMTSAQENALRLYHLENEGWDRVVPCSVDTENNTVCGSVNSFSLFAIFEDVAPPEINSISANPNVLWPANHKMVKVTVEVNATDNSGSAPFCYVLGVDGVTSDEPVNGLGDGNTEPDWEYTDNPLAVLLRAERAGGGTGRVYTIYIECTDASGNIATGMVEVTVPHDQGKGKAKGKK